MSTNSCETKTANATKYQVGFRNCLQLNIIPIISLVIISVTNLIDTCKMKDKVDYSDIQFQEYN